MTLQKTISAQETRTEPRMMDELRIYLKQRWNQSKLQRDLHYNRLLLHTL